jgi:hypothetical protein
MDAKNGVVERFIEERIKEDDCSISWITSSHY